MEPRSLEVKPMVMWEERRKGHVFTFRYPNMHAYEMEFRFLSNPFLLQFKYHACCHHWQVSHAVVLFAICICRTSFRLGTDHRHPERKKTPSHMQAHHLCKEKETHL